MPDFLARVETTVLQAASAIPLPISHEMRNELHCSSEVAPDGPSWHL